MVKLCPLLTLLATVSLAVAAPQEVERLVVTPDTCFLLTAKDGAVKDVSGRNTAVKATGVSFVDDPSLGEVMRFGSRGAELLVPDQGAIGFKDGLMIEALVFLETPVPEDGYGFLRKSVNTAWGANPISLGFVAGNRLKLGALHFDGEEIEYATFPGMHEWTLKPDPTYPLPGNTMNGLYDIVTGRWTHVAFTYNRARRHLATWVDRGIDREAFNPVYDCADTLIDEDDAPLRLFRGATGLRVAEVRFSSKADLKGHAAPVRVFVSELPYRGYSYIHVVPVADDLPLPLEITVENVLPPYRAPIAKYVLDTLEPQNFRIPAWPFKNVETELVVRLVKKGREFWKYETLLINPSVASPATWRMIRKDGGTMTATKRPDWWIESDNTITYRGKPVFPLMTSHVAPADLDKVLDLGFTMISLMRPAGMKTFDTSWTGIVDDCCAKAAERGAWIQVGSDKNDRPGEGFLYAFDEPWGHSFVPMFATYRYLRNGRQRPADLPVTGGQNNWQRYRETGCVTDIFAVDPYWRGRVPMRSIYDSVRTAIRETDGLKPITLDVGNWGPRSARPTYDELRTMSYLGIIAGCRSLYFYSWDEGPDANTAEMPDICEHYRKLFAEFRAFDEALTVPNIEPGPAAEPAQPRGFFACAKKPRTGGKTYLFVASDLYKTTTKTLVFPSAAGKSARLVSAPGLDGASPELAFSPDGRASLALPPLSAAIYVY